ncbi:MAG: hypothetical protein EAZ51_03045 [Sphingobacteriales bacterium]|nr:MAG: hypothetical protein EAZ64_05735 [Sphingobacteriales bacterium]TAF82086.1 MAG: hypothetical protein EAZ51_03045 [Sphingobacteriales bacterium]
MCINVGLWCYTFKKTTFYSLGGKVIRIEVFFLGIFWGTLRAVHLKQHQFVNPPFNLLSSTKLKISDKNLKLILT